MSDAMYKKALEYTARGWHVFPCVEGGKRPLTKHGLKDATRNPTQIGQWWTDHPDANIGVSCGPSGLVVIDVDNPEGTQTLVGLDGYDFPRTLSSVTGSGGAHYFYRMPDPPVKNTAGRLPGVEGDTQGLDCRGDGGYVVVPPSRTEGVYAWLPDRWATEPVAAPEWLREPQHERPSMNLEALLDIDPPGPAYARKALEDETARVAAALKGTRNDTLVRASFSLGQLVAVGLLDQSDVVWHLAGAAVSAGLGRGEAEATLDRGLKAGREHPRQVAV